jgi:hypothetical protein
LPRLPARPRAGSSTGGVLIGRRERPDKSWSRKTVQRAGETYPLA